MGSWKMSSFSLETKVKLSGWFSKHPADITFVITLHITHRYDIKPKEDLVNVQSPVDHFVQQSVFSKS